MGADIGQKTGVEPGRRMGELNKPIVFVLLHVLAKLICCSNHKGP